MNLVLNLGLILLFAFVLGMILASRRLPEITGYVLAGVALGPSALNLINQRLLDSAETISLTALALIAFSISRELSLDIIRNLGTKLLTITIAQAMGALVFVFVTMWLLFGQPFDAALIMGSIALATAPATVFLVVKQFHAKGELTKILLVIVALDDALGLIVFGLATGVALAVAPGRGFSFALILKTLYHVVASFGLGVVVGVSVLPVFKRTHRFTDRLVFTLGIILSITGLSIWLDFSPLLSSLSMGTVLANTFNEADHVFSIIENFSQPIYALFFVVGGAILDLKLLASIGLLGVGYLISRALGKYVGAFIGASLAKSPASIRQWLGIALMPQAGIAVGLAIVASHQFPDFGIVLANIVIASSIIYELIGPAFTELALNRVGEIKSRS